MKNSQTQSWLGEKRPQLVSGKFMMHSNWGLAKLLFTVMVVLLQLDLWDHYIKIMESIYARLICTTFLLKDNPDKTRRSVKLNIHAMCIVHERHERWLFCVRFQNEIPRYLGNYQFILNLTYFGLKSIRI